MENQQLVHHQIPMSHAFSYTSHAISGHVTRDAVWVPLLRQGNQNYSFWLLNYRQLPSIAYTRNA